MSDTGSRAVIAKTEAETAKIRAETAKTVVTTLAECLKTAGIVASLLLASYANCTKADTEKVEKAATKTVEAIDAINENVQTQHKQTEKIRETVEDTTKAVKTLASAPVSTAAIPIQSKEPKKSGCWLVYGGVVRCKGVGEQKRATPVRVPSAPPPAPPPKPVSMLRGEM